LNHSILFLGYYSLVVFFNLGAITMASAHLTRQSGFAPWSPWRDGGEKRRRDSNSSEKHHWWWWLFTRSLPRLLLLFLVFFVIFVWVLSMIEFGFW